MASGKPVVVSDVLPMKRLVEEIGCGRVYQDYNQKNLCDVIAELSDSGLRRILARKGRDAIEQEYNWAREEQVMYGSLDNLKKIN